MFQLSASIPNIEKGLKSIIEEMHVIFSFRNERKARRSVKPRLQSLEV